MQYRRAKTPGGTYFFTVVTHDRRPWLQEPLSTQTLGDAMRQVREQRPFDNLAMVLMPDHLHCIWRLPKKRCRFFNPVDVDQASRDAPLARSDRRPTFVAKPVLGACLARPPRCGATHPLHPFQSCQARSCCACPRLAVQHVSSLCEEWNLPTRLGCSTGRIARSQRVML